MYTEFDNLIWIYIVFGIVLGMLPLIVVFAIAVLFVVMVVRAMKGQQPPPGPGAAPNRSALWQMVLAILMTQGRHPGSTGSGQPGPAGLSARQDVINAGADPTPRP